MDFFRRPTLPSARVDLHDIISFRLNSSGFLSPWFFTVIEPSILYFIVYLRSFLTLGQNYRGPCPSCSYCNSGAFMKGLTFIDR